MRNFIPVLLLGWLFTSCVYDVYDPGRCMDATLDITVEFPAVPVLKSEVGEVPGSAAENAIHDLKIWVYTSEDHAPVTSMTVDASEFPPAGGARRYALHTSRTFAAAPPPVDVFILANAASIGSALTTADTWENVTNTEVVSSWADVHDAIIGADYFGVKSPVHAVPEGGLPMSAMAQSQTVSGSEPFLGLNPLALTRAVSKFRCVFSQMAFNSSNPDALAQISVDKITLNGNQIPLQEYVFTAGNTGIVPGSQYDTTSFKLTGPGTEIPSSSTPERYRYVNQDALTYETLLEEGVARGELSHFDGDVTYFRESDLQLTGRIDYTVTKGTDVQKKSKEFAMDASGDGDFARNHIWTLYGYFVRDMSLQLSVGVLPWDKQFYSIDFSDAAIWADPKFYVEESTALAAETKDGYRNIYVNRSSPVVAFAPIKTPVGGKLYIRTMGQDDLFVVTPSPFGEINPNVPVKITIGASNKTGSGSITLKFVVEAGGREMLADSELIDTRYRFILQ